MTETTTFGDMEMLADAGVTDVFDVADTGMDASEIFDDSQDTIDESEMVHLQTETAIEAVVGNTAGYPIRVNFTDLYFAHVSGVMSDEDIEQQAYQLAMMNQDEYEDLEEAKDDVNPEFERALFVLVSPDGEEIGAVLESAEGEDAAQRATEMFMEGLDTENMTFEAVDRDDM